MSANNIFKRIIQFFKSGKRTSGPKLEAPQEAAMLSKLLQMVANTDEVEISCDELFELLDRYVEVEVSGEDAAVLLPLVKKHLDRCMDCHEEYEALLRILQASA